MATSGAARVIVCKLGRFGELKKILDKSPTNPNPLNQDQRPKVTARRAKKSAAGLCSLSLTSPFLHSLLTDNEEIQEEEPKIVSECQFVSPNGGLMLDDVLRDNILSLRVGDAVRKFTQ